MKKRLLLGLALGLVFALCFAVSAMAGPQLDCKGELPGGYSFTGPEEITVRAPLHMPDGEIRRLLAEKRGR